MSVLLIAAFGVLFALLSVASLYNGLVRKKNMAQEAWSGIDVQLKRRSDLIPNLVATVKGYMTHEKEVLENVTASRAATMAAQTPPQRLAAEGLLSGALGRLFAVVENYPELKANESFLDLQRDISDTEEQIQLARRYYNGAARDLNIEIQSFPTNLMAKSFGFAPMDYFEIENAAERAVPKVAFE